jgi:(p)ppGpp synthase/HD superfamily hydrolase
MKSDLIELAKEIATKTHKGQKRWDGSDYINHPARIAQLLKDQGASDIEIAAAWLHDVIEDTGMLNYELANKINDTRVSYLVDLLTHYEDQSYVEYILRMKQEIKTGVDYFKLAAKIKSLDILDNLRSNPEKISKTRRDKYELAYYILTGEVLRH